MKNKTLKQELIKQKTNIEYNKLRFDAKQKAIEMNLNEDEIANAINEELQKNFNNETIEACEQLRKAKQQQTRKIKKHIEYFFRNDYELFFATFTYSNSKIKKENIAPETLKKYCIEAMQDFDDYIINIDYGKKNMRMHYHCLIAMKPNKIKYTFKKVKNAETHKNELCVFFQNEAMEQYIQKTGAIYCKKVFNKTEKDKTQIARYIAKLTLHSIKIKQKYVSTKKGTEYQKEKAFFEKAIKRRNELSKKHNCFVSLKEAIATDGALLHQYAIKLGEKTNNAENA